MPLDHNKLGVIITEHVGEMVGVYPSLTNDFEFEPWNASMLCGRALGRTLPLL